MFAGDGYGGGGMSANEEWRPAVGFEGLYSVSSFGRVRSEPRAVVEKTGAVKRLRGREIKPRVNRGGYLCLAFCVNGQRVPVRVHGVVALAFIGPKPSERHEVAHNDGDRTNNRASNLRWDTRTGNFADKVTHGTHNRGERHPNSRLSNAAVAEIRASKIAADQVARVHGISLEHAKRVLANNKRKSG